MALKDIPQTFGPDNEEEVRVAIAQFFLELGYVASEMSFEDKFTIYLGHAPIELGVAPKTKRRRSKQRTQVAGRSDLLLARNGQPLAIIETKAPDHALTDKDALQALSYARLLLSMPPYAIVTNGRETRIYDTFAPHLQGLDELKELELPTESSWFKNGQQVLSLSDELRYHVARTLIGINPQTLHLFCQKQVSTALEDLKGMATEIKPYIPEVYLPRLQAEEQFSAWVSSNQPCFALVSDSGIGKTTMMCAAAEQLLADGYFVLFYSASNLQRDLESAICNDFVWEFHREKGLATIVERFEDITRTLGKKVFHFLDGLDRFPGKQEQLKAELLALVPRLRNHSIKLCLSCKSFDWERFIIDDARSYNKLAMAIYPQLQQSRTIAQPSAREVGTWLFEFTDEELDQVFPRYQQIFSLKGSLKGTTRKAGHHPLILRLLSEVWSGQKAVLPQEISQLELFEEYWRIQIHKVQHNKLEAELWLAELARMSVEAGERQIPLTELRQHLSSQGDQDEIYQALMRSGLLRVSFDKYGEAMLSFGLDTIRSYVYTVKAQMWPRQIERGKSREIASLICQLLEQPAGVEAVEFYVRTIDRGETRLLTDIALHDIFKFVQLLGLLRVRSFVFAATTDEEQRQGFISYMTQFVIAYSELLHKYFPDLCEKVEPYKKGAVGLWISGSPRSTTYQFRERTEAMPDPLIILQPDAALALSKQQVSREFYDQVRPGGRVNIDLRGFGMVEHLPQKLAWNHLLSQVAGLLRKRCLDESASPFLLHERIWRLLSVEPAGFWGGVPNATKYWQDFGFQSLEDIQNVPLEEVITHTQALIEQYLAQYDSQIQRHLGLIQQESNASPVAEPAWSRWYVTYIRKLRRLDFFLHQCLDFQESHVTFPDWRYSNVFDYLRTGDLIPVVQLLQQFLPHILQSYLTVAQKNISFFADQLALVRHSDASMLVEVTRESSNPSFRSDFLKVAYVILPTTTLPDKYMVYTCQEKDSVKRILLQRKTLLGHCIQTSGIQGARFGQGEISQQIGGRYIYEPNAFFCFTQFPSHYPLLDQVYQLLGNELAILLDGDFSDWHNIELSKIDDEMLDMFIDQQAGRI